MARLLFFGKLAEIARGRERSLPLPGHVDTVSDLVKIINAEDQILGAAMAEKSVRYVVNEKIEHGSAAICDDDEIAFLPPVSGG